MFAIPIAVIAICVYFAVYCVDLRMTTAKQKKQQARHDAAEQFIHTVARKSDNKLFEEFFEKYLWGKVDNAFGEFSVFMGDSSEKWHRFFGAYSYAIMKMAKLGKYPYKLITHVDFSPKLHDEKGIDSEFIEMSERFMLRVEDELNKRHPGLNAVMCIQTPLPGSYQYMDGKLGTLDKEYSLRDFVAKYGYGKTLPKTNYKFANYNEYIELTPLV